MIVYSRQCVLAFFERNEIVITAFSKIELKSHFSFTASTNSVWSHLFAQLALLHNDGFSLDNSFYDNLVIS